MEQIQVEIVVQTITAQYGTLDTGTLLRCPADFAAHLVDDCKSAKYVASVGALPDASRADAQSDQAFVQTSAQDAVVAEQAALQPVQDAAASEPEPVVARASRRRQAPELAKEG